MAKRALFWFRNDLRLHDQQALMTALNWADEIIPVYILDEQLFEVDSCGNARMGAFRLRFLLESLTVLKANLQRKGADLLIEVGKPEQLIPQLCEKWKVGKCVASKETGYEESLLESALSQKLMAQKIETVFVQQSTLLHEDDIPWPIANLPDIFTAFRKENEKSTPIRKCVDSPKSIAVPTDFVGSAVPTINQFFDTVPKKDERAALDIKGGTQEGLLRLQHYLWDTDSLRNYKFTRNGLLGADYSSKFSPWLALGCISPRKIYEQVKLYEEKRHKNVSTYWLIFELYWRDYFHFVMKKYGSKLFGLHGIKGESTINWQENKSVFELWKNGLTGVPFVDANMRELNATGFMSNRGRQLVASFLTKDLHIDWRWGAAYFEQQLIDYDVASNWGNWAYVAGVGNDPREDRYFNILSQAKTYDPKGEYVKTWIPELAEIKGFAVHHPATLAMDELAEANVELGKTYPRPLIEMSRWLY